MAPDKRNFNNKFLHKEGNFRKVSFKKKNIYGNQATGHLVVSFDGSIQRCQWSSASLTNNTHNFNQRTVLIEFTLKM